MLMPRDTQVFETLQCIRERTRAFISISLTDFDALNISIVCGMIESVALLEYTQERTVRADSIAAQEKLAITDDEFIVLFGTVDPAALRPRQSSGDTKRILEYENLAESREYRKRIETALITTLLEDSQKKAWHSSAAIRVAAQVALCRSTDAAACLSSVIGGMVRADRRRIDDLRCTIEDDGLDIMVVAQAAAALAASVAA